MSEAMRLTSTKWPRWLVPNWVSNPSAVLPNGQAMTPALAMTRSNGLPLSTSVLAQARTLSSDAKIKVDELKSAAVRAACSEARGRRFGLGQIARGADHVSAMSDERARRLHAEAG